MRDPRSLPPVEIVETIPALERLADGLRDAVHVAVDLEADSFYTYHAKVCLIQLSALGRDFIVDPLSVRDLSPLGPLFRDPDVEKVFHASEHDLQCLRRDYGFEVATLFDTMAAARLLGAGGLGLASLIQKYFGVRLSKKLQRSDWGKRPLSGAQIDYARMDTHYLLPLRDILWKELHEHDLLEESLEEFSRLARIEHEERAFDPDAFWRWPGAKGLPPRDRAVLKELCFYREKTAAALDRAPFRVLPEALLVRLAQETPRDPSSLERVHGMTPYLFQRFGAELLEVIERGMGLPPIDSPPERPKRQAWSGPALRRYQQLRQWRIQKARERRVDSVVILATEDLRALSRAPELSPDPKDWLGSLSPLKRELYGEELAALLQKTPPPPAGRRRRRR